MSSAFELTFLFFNHPANADENNGIVGDFFLDDVASTYVD